MPSGILGGVHFTNVEGSLPKTTKDGKPIVYHEFDVKKHPTPSQVAKGMTRGV